MIRKVLAKFGLYRPRAGDVVLDRWDDCEKTVAGVVGQRATLQYFIGSQLRCDHVPKSSLQFVR